MFELNAKIKNLTPYTPSVGQYPIRLDANESFITLSQAEKDVLAQAVDGVHLNRYPDPLAAGVCAGFAAFYGVPQSCVVAGNGSDELISILMTAFLETGDTVLTLSPDFSMYNFYADVAQCRVETLETVSYHADVQEIAAAVQRTKARMLIFSNPCNPTGTQLDRAAVRQLLRAVDGTLVVLDEAYMDFSDQSMLAEFADYDNLLILKTCSKALGLAGIRLGFAVGQERLIRVLQAVKSPYNVNSVTQAIGEAIFSMPQALRRDTQRIIESRAALQAEFDALAAQYPDAFSPVESSANFVFVRCADADGLFAFLQKKGILVRKLGTHLRITAGRNYENEAVVREITAYLKGERV